MYLSCASSELCVPEADFWHCLFHLNGKVVWQRSHQSILLEAPPVACAGGEGEGCENPCSAEILEVGGLAELIFLPPFWQGQWWKHGAYSAS